MPIRKHRIHVVFDTNIVVAFYFSKTESIVKKFWQYYWRSERKLQLVISPELRDEYLVTLERLRVTTRQIQLFTELIDFGASTTRVNLGTRFTASSDPDDNIVLATAAAGNAEFLVTRDHHLLDIPEKGKRKFRFKILSPDQFLFVIQSRSQ